MTDSILNSEADWGKLFLSRLGATAVLLGLTVFIYYQIVSYGLLEHWDDAPYILERLEVRHWFTVSWYKRLLTPALGYPVPLPTALYAAGMEWFPEPQLGPILHAVSLGFHGLNVYLAFRLAEAWSERRSIAFVVAIVWTSHPLLVETVAFATNLKSVLLGTSVLSASFAWHEYLTTSRPRWAVGAVIIGLVGLGCRPEAVMIGPLLVLQTFLFGERPQWTKPATLLAVGTMILAAGIYLPIAVIGHQVLVTQDRMVHPDNPYTMGWRIRLIRIGAALFIQMKHVIWPHELHPWYNPSGAERIAMAPWGAGIALLLAVGTYAAYRHSRASAIGAAFFWLFYLPVSGIEFLPRFTADTYMYLPLFGLVFAVAVGVRALLPLDRRWVRLPTAIVGGVLMLALATTSHVQTWRWQNTVRLWTPVAEAYPEARLPFEQLGHHFVGEGEYERARMFYERSAEKLPFAQKPPELAGVYVRLGEIERAAELILKRLEARGSKAALANQIFLIQTATTHRLDFSDEPRTRQTVRRAARKALDALSERNEPSTLLGIAEYLASRSYHDVASLYLKRALSNNPDLCSEASDISGSNAVKRVRRQYCGSK